MAKYSQRVTLQAIDFKLHTKYILNTLSSKIHVHVSTCMFETRNVVQLKSLHFQHDRS